jgi:putative nucleotidyltransferase with HDIG domain
MPVHIIADTADKLSNLRAKLEGTHAITCELLGEAPDRSRVPDAIVVRIDLHDAENVAALKSALESLNHVRKRIFFVDQKARLLTVQAYALGATHVLLHPVRAAQLLAKLADTLGSENSADDVSNGSRGAASAAAAALTSMFAAVLSGKPVDPLATKNAGSRIADSVAEDWLDTVRRHHEGTYQHCLLVAGIAVDFGLSLGMMKADIERLYSAAMYHDIGKAKIPLAVLDKSDRLDDRERALIETHTVTGYEALKDNAAISAEVLDAVRHHHEYLDGSGYPDALCGNSITDIVRMLTISDIFSALIEHRPYRSTMSRDQAYEVLRGMHGKLEMPLVAAFGEVALNR